MSSSTYLLQHHVCTPRMCNVVGIPIVSCYKRLRRAPCPSSWASLWTLPPPDIHAWLSIMLYLICDSKYSYHRLHGSAHRARALFQQLQISQYGIARLDECLYPEDEYKYCSLSSTKNFDQTGLPFHQISLDSYHLSFIFSPSSLCQFFWEYTPYTRSSFHIFKSTKTFRVIKILLFLL